ncbi:MAG TPA: glycoside hydrolase family 3 N-terminal domain-containing protein [Flavitalea sp.]|nr:glycoside hydrolase family 3 N-terminal domain-containing protein [Flavitalea sp.]
MNRSGIIAAFLMFSLIGNAQKGNPAADRWVDSVFKTLSKNQKIAQLMVVRLSSIDGATRKITFYDREVADVIRKYNIGGVCLFQGGPLKQAALVNSLQRLAKTPLLIAIDGETGVGMRLDSVMALPRQMMMGAVEDPLLIYQYGKLVGEQCKRMGIHVNYAPVVDINNNPNNPVINDRSFGENKYRVAAHAIQYMKGMQDVGVMACAKHFPGHGDVDVDSHYDLPVINKSKEQLDSLELYPFREIFKAGIGSVMIAHLSIPAIDKTANTPTSLSKNNVTALLRNELGYQGLTFTDALEMKGVTKYFPDGDASVQSLIAGNDMLCLPGDISNSIKKINTAIRKNKLKWQEIDAHVKKVLYAKFQLGLASLKPVELRHLTEDLNYKVAEMRQNIAEKAITLLRNDEPSLLPLSKGKKIAYVGFGSTKDNAFARSLRNEYDAHVYYFDYRMNEAKANAILALLKDRYDIVVIGLHAYSRFPANNFNVSSTAITLIHQLQQDHKTVTLAFGNPYIIKNLCDSRVLIACYEDDEITQMTAADLMKGRFIAKGKLPVTVCPAFPFGAGIVAERLLPVVESTELGFNSQKLEAIDSIVEDAIQKRAIPGAVVMIVKDGKIGYERAFGYLTYDSLEPVYTETMYDLASVTKIMATTMAVMKLYDEGRLDLRKTLGDYLPWVRGSNKEKILISDLLIHEAGLKAWIPFYRETVDTLYSNTPSGGIYSPITDSLYSIRVAENVYMRRDWRDTMYRRILESELGPRGTYVYSDNDFIFLGKVVEALSGMTLDEYVKKTFYDKLELKNTTFLPRAHFPLSFIAPTEREAGFRQQLLHGDVHDPGAAMFGGVSGHAGLFSNAYEMAVLSQVFLNGGKMNGTVFFKKETIDLFTAYHSENSRRGLGFDKPEKDNATREEPYPALSASPLTFGHTGFTGTCVWMDPQNDLVFIFLSNRVNNNGDANRFLRMNVRPKIHEVIYQALRN